MRYLLVLLLMPSLAYAEINSVLQSELIDMGTEDQRVRNEVGKSGWQNAPEKLLLQLREVDKSNTVRLKSIIKDHSFPTTDLVGNEAMAAVFLIVQHSADSDFQQRMLTNLKQSHLDDNGVTGQQVALLTDRVLIGLGKKQLYGTQYDLIDSAIVFKPIEDISTVDALRMEMNMPPLAFYLKLLEKIHGLGDHPDIEVTSS